MKEEEQKLHKGRECIYCKKRFECKGKPNLDTCLRFEEESNDRESDK